MAALQISPMLNQIQKNFLAGTIMELGPSPFHPGLALLDKPDLDLLGLGFTPEQMQTALAEAKQREVQRRVKYSADKMTPFPFASNSVDGVISYGALHAWENPLQVFDEIARVLKIGGIFFISDIRRDVNPWLLRILAYGRTELKNHFHSHLGNLKTVQELKDLLPYSHLAHATVEKQGLEVWIYSSPAPVRKK